MTETLRICSILLLFLQAKAIDASAAPADVSALVQGRLEVSLRKDAGDSTTLPEGWESAIDPNTGSEYYWPSTDRSAVTWDRPQKKVVRPAPVAQPVNTVQAARPAAQPASSVQVARPVAQPANSGQAVRAASPLASSVQAQALRCEDRAHALEEKLAQSQAEVVSKSEALRQVANDKLAFNQDLLVSAKSKLKECEGERISLEQVQKDQAAECHEELQKSRRWEEALRLQLRDQARAAANQSTQACQARINELEQKHLQMMEAELKRVSSQDAELATLKAAAARAENELKQAHFVREQEVNLLRTELSKVEEQPMDCSARIETATEPLKAAVERLHKALRVNEEEEAKRLLECKEECGQHNNTWQDRGSANLQRGAKAPEKVHKCQAELAEQRFTIDELQERLRKARTQYEKLQSKMMDMESSADRAEQAEEEVRELTEQVKSNLEVKSMQEGPTRDAIAAEKEASRAREYHEKWMDAEDRAKAAERKAADLEKEKKSNTAEAAEAQEYRHKWLDAEDRAKVAERKATDLEKEKRSKVTEVVEVHEYHQKWLEAEERAKAAEKRATELEARLKEEEEDTKTEESEVVKSRDDVGLASLGGEATIRKRIDELEAELERQRGINAAHMHRWLASEARITALMEQLRPSDESIPTSNELLEEVRKAAKPHTTEVRQVPESKPKPTWKANNAQRANNAHNAQRRNQQVKPKPAQDVHKQKPKEKKVEEVLPALPTGWERVYSEVDKKYYYWHIASGNTTWQIPVVAASRLDEAPPPPMAALHKVGESAGTATRSSEVPAVFLRQAASEVLKQTEASLRTFKASEHVEVQQQHGPDAGKWTQAIVLRNGVKPNTYDIRVPKGSNGDHQVLAGIHASALRRSEE